MKNKLLLPNRFKKIGWLILLFSAVLGLSVMFVDFQFDWLYLKTFAIVYTEESGLGTSYLGFVSDNLTNEIAGTLFLIGGLFVTFSREKNEDEYIANLRLNSLLWSVLVSYGLLIFAFLFIYGFAFLNVMMCNMFTTLIIFITRFNIILFKNSKLLSNEK